jgi:hypothetical protein
MLTRSPAKQLSQNEKMSFSANNNYLEKIASASHRKTHSRHPEQNARLDKLLRFAANLQS